jgi:putative hydrolase of the HAD superfamily
MKSRWKTPLYPSSLFSSSKNFQAHRRTSPTRLQLIFMAEIKAVLFDYGMVLSAAPDPVAWTRMLAVTNLSEEQLHRGYWTHRLAYDRGDLTAESFWSRAAAPTHGILTQDQLTALIAADVDYWSTLNPPMLAWASNLQQAGIPTGILSNMPGPMEVGLRARYHWIDNFTHNTWSHSLNLAKPEPAIYRHAAEGLRTPSENILFLDDRTENIEAAHAIGMQAILYTTHYAFEQEMRARGLNHLLQLQGHTASQNGKL